MDMIQAIVLFVLGVGAALLAYFAWHHIQLGQGATVSSASSMPQASPAIAMQG